MAETIHVNGVSNSLAHKGCMGFVKNTVPDVCKTPGPGGPIPIPYPVIVSFAKDLSKGTKTVKVDGGNSAAIKGSEYSRCIGDEPGTAGGIISNTNMKEATWLLYSFDVKMENKNACRLSDKMMMNHKNTVSLGGAIHPPVASQLGLDSDEKAVADCLCDAFCDEVKRGFKKGPRGGYRKKKNFTRRHNWSYNLERKLEKNPPACLSGKNVTFTEQFKSPSGKKTIPDANLKDVSGSVVRCFDFKFPGDRLRGTQETRQTKLAGGNKVVPISTKTCNCN